MRLTERLLVRHHPSGRFLTGSGLWVDDTADALAFEDRSDALRVLTGWACEPHSLEVVSEVTCLPMAGVA